MKEENNSAAIRYCALLRRHERSLRWLCLRRAWGDPDLADDYFQEVSLLLWRYLDRFYPSLSPRQERAYVKRAALYALSHCSRKKRLDQQLLRDDLTAALEQRDREDEQLLNSLVEELPEDDRIVVGLFRAGYDTGDIARFLGITPNAVSQRLHRIVTKMRTLYYKEYKP